MSGDTILLTIKGTKEQAQIAAFDRKIQARLVEEHWNFTLMRCPTEQVRAVVEWFLEDLEERPYRYGSLLHYQLPDDYA